MVHGEFYHSMSYPSIQCLSCIDHISGDFILSVVLGM